jgi:hypothetical protein
MYCGAGIRAEQGKYTIIGLAHRDLAILYLFQAARSLTTTDTAAQGPTLLSSS